MEIGLYFGSFNPIHIGHLIIASHVCNKTPVGKVWFVVSPQNPFKNSSQLLNEYDRLHLVNLALEDDPRFQSTNIEFSLPRPSYTIDTLIYLEEKFPQHKFSLVMGSDSWQNFKSWKNYDQILKVYRVTVYERPGFPVKTPHENLVVLKDAPLLQISASYIRSLLKEKKSVRYLVPPKVEEEILNSGYFQ